MLRNIHIWLPAYFNDVFARFHSKRMLKPDTGTVHVLFAICDHFEPFWQTGDKAIAYKRVKKWVEALPEICSRHKDSEGRKPAYCLFYPEEEYDRELLEMLASICRAGYAETEIHLHHDNDNAENLANTLNNFKTRLSDEHGLLCRERGARNVRYGFIHGNWALDNSRPDGRWCGVNSEIDVLLQTGCYADFTMPSAPDITQTSTINRIYYAVDNPDKPKSHDHGIRAKYKKPNGDGLMCIQGPLGFNYKLRKFGLIPKIENSCVAYDCVPTDGRARIWVNSGIHIDGRPDIVFVKLYTHGTQEKNIEYLIDKGGLDLLYSIMENHFNDDKNYCLHYISARQMYNAVRSLEKGYDIKDKDFFESELILIQ